MFGSPPVSETPSETPAPASAPTGQHEPQAQADAGTAAPGATPQGSTAPAAIPPAALPATAGAGPDTRDELVLGSGQTPMFGDQPSLADPLTIGGQLYLRMQTSASEGQPVDKYRLSMPTLLDVFFDARPNDRVRGFVLGRMSYDPTLPPPGSNASNVGDPLTNGGTSGSASLSSLFTPGTNAPRVVLDQLWLRFDVAHTLFVTAGKQHVRWGTARFWTPTDYLHLRRRNPLDVFDARTGTTMVKVHLPIESNSWNFYAYGVTEGQTGTPTLASLAGAARAEFVLDSTELGLGVFGRPHSRAKLAADVSTGLGDFDLYGELAVLDNRDSDRVRFEPNATIPIPAGWTTLADFLNATAEEQALALRGTVDALYPKYQRRGYRPQAVAGLSYSRKYNDNDLFTIGAEYFYNGLGYQNDDVYPGIALPRTSSLRNPPSFFYLGQHYAALFLLLPSPFKWDLHTFTLSTLGNLSDRSFITRLDYSLVLLTHLRFEAFAAVHYGRPNGEFRFGIDLSKIAGIDLPVGASPALFDLGVALRLAI
jgi:hypothetical protein